MNDGPVINDLRGYTCREVCPHYDKATGCIYAGCYPLVPVDCPEMLREYTTAVKLERRPRVKPKEAS